MTIAEFSNYTKHHEQSRYCFASENQKNMLPCFNCTMYFTKVLTSEHPNIIAFSDENNQLVFNHVSSVELIENGCPLGDIINISCTELGKETTYAFFRA